MTTDTARKEESMDLARLFLEALRGWRWMFVAAVLVAVLLGVRSFLNPGLIGRADDIAYWQEVIDHNTENMTEFTSLINKNLDSIANSRTKIQSNTTKIEGLQVSLRLEQEKLPKIEETISHLQDLISDPGLSSAESAELLIQLREMQDAADNSEYLITSSYPSQIAELQRSSATEEANIAALEERNAELSVETELFQGKIDTGNRKMEQYNLPYTGFGRHILAAGKGFLLGFIAGYAVLCLLQLFKFVFTNKLRGANELKERYRLPVLGDFASARALRSHGKFGKFIDRLEGKAHVLEEDEICRMISAEILVSDPACRRLVITGTGEEADCRELQEKLKELLPEDLEVIADRNPVYNPELLKGLKDSTLLLAEKPGVSYRKELDELTDVLTRCGIKVVGAVVL